MDGSIKSRIEQLAAAASGSSSPSPGAGVGLEAFSKASMPNAAAHLPPRPRARSVKASESSSSFENLSSSPGSWNSNKSFTVLSETSPRSGRSIGLPSSPPPATSTSISEEPVRRPVSSIISLYNSRGTAGAGTQSEGAVDQGSSKQDEGPLSSSPGSNFSLDSLHKPLQPTPSRPTSPAKPTSPPYEGRPTSLDEFGARFRSSPAPSSPNWQPPSSPFGPPSATILNARAQFSAPTSPSLSPKRGLSTHSISSRPGTTSSISQLEEEDDALIQLASPSSTSKTRSQRHQLHAPTPISSLGAPTSSSRQSSFSANASAGSRSPASIVPTPPLPRRPGSAASFRSVDQPTPSVAVHPPPVLPPRAPPVRARTIGVSSSSSTSSRSSSISSRARSPPPIASHNSNAYATFSVGANQNRSHTRHNHNSSMASVSLSSGGGEEIAEALRHGDLDNADDGASHLQATTAASNGLAARPTSPFAGGRTSPRLGTRPPPAPPSSSGMDLKARKRYEVIFDRLVVSAGKRSARPSQAENHHGLTNGATEAVDALVVYQLWLRSRLPVVTLRSIWTASDPYGRGKLDRDGFCLGMSKIDEELRRLAARRW